MTAEEVADLIRIANDNLPAEVPAGPDNGVMPPDAVAGGAGDWMHATASVDLAGPDGFRGMAHARSVGLGEPSPHRPEPTAADLVHHIIAARLAAARAVTRIIAAARSRAPEAKVVALEGWWMKVTVATDADGVTCIYVDCTYRLDRA